MNKDKFDIVPSTKVAELLKHYPELENALMQFSPAFAALKNPVLRRTVAKVTSLQQAAKVGNKDIVEMINFLREHVGLPKLEESAYHEGAYHASFSNSMPETPVTFILDVRPIIDAGEHPKDEVLAQAQKLNSGECMEFIAPFPPIPLLDALNKRGFKTTMLPANEGIVRSFVERK